MAYVAMGLAASSGILLAAFESPLISRSISLPRISAGLVAAALALAAAGTVVALLD